MTHVIYPRRHSDGKVGATKGEALKQVRALQGFDEKPPSNQLKGISHVER